MAGLTTSLATTNSTVAGLGTSVTNLTTSLATTDAAVAGLGTSLATTNSTVSNLGTQLTTTNSNIAGLGTSVTGLTTSLAGTDATVSALSSAVTAANQLAVRYTPDAAGNPTNSVALTGSGNGAPVAITNLAAGAVSANSSDAVNGAQLFAVQQQAVAGGIQYDTNVDGSFNRSSLTLGTAGLPTQIRNVANGQANTDAANFGQVQAAQAAAISQAVTILIQSGACQVVNTNLICGTGSSASGTNATVTGVNAQSNGNNSSTFGNGAQSNFNNAVAFGSNARGQADGATAIGTGAIASGANSVALGNGAVASGANSVALGAGALADRPNTVSVGNTLTGSARQITNVAAGTAPTDAVNLEQFQAGLDGFSGIVAGEARAYARRGIAAALAVPNLTLEAGHKQVFGGSFGYYDGYTAVGIAYARRINNNAQINLGVSGGEASEVAVRGGFQIGW